MATTPKRYLPVYLDLEGRLVLVVGGDEPARRKVRHLIKYGADITVITPSPDPWLLEQGADGAIVLEQRSYQSGDLRGCTVAFCYDSDPAVRAAFRDESLRTGCPVNVAGDHEASSFLVPGVVSRPPLQFAVSTGGMAPELAKHVRTQLASQYPEHWGPYVEFIGEVRRLLFDAVDDDARRSELLATVIASDAEQRMAAGETVDPAQIVEALLAHTPDTAQE